MTPIDTAHVLLSSVLWNFTNADKQAFIRTSRRGTFGTHGYNLTLGNGGISLLHSKYISASVWAQITTAQKGIECGHDQGPGDDDGGAGHEALRK